MSSTIVSKKNLITVWIALLVLLLLTWGLAQLDLHHFNVAAALTIALVKMLWSSSSLCMLGTSRR